MINKLLLSIAFLFSIITIGQIPSLAVHDHKQKVQLPIHTLAIQVDVVGTISKTTFDITFHNPHDQVLEGDFSFPLLDGQEVCRYALDINGNLREGVVIEKVKARQVFEAVVRQNIDPGILSKTKGNYYKTRIYPIPPKGYKRVVFAVENQLPIIDGQLNYQLPLEMKEPIDKFSLQVDVLKSEQKPMLNSDGYSDFVFDSTSEIYQMHFEREKYIPTKTVSFTVPFFGNKEAVVYTEKYKGETYFYATVKTPKLESKVKRTPKSIAVYWDVSFSGRKRNTALELEFLQQYLQKIAGQKEVCVHTFNYEGVHDQAFNLTEDTSLLISYLKDRTYDGATRFEKVNFSAAYDEILFFSDGIATIGADDIIVPKTPIYSFSTSSGANYSFLKYLATTTNGTYFALSKKTLPETIRKMQKASNQNIYCDFSKKDFKDVVISPVADTHDYVTVTGVVKNPEAALRLNFGDGKVTEWSKNIRIKANTVDKGLIPRVWAGSKIRKLDMQYQKNKEEITKLGKEFAIVTRNTSFIVLDRVEDYITHNIEPPKELLKEYTKLVAKQVKNSFNDEKYIQNTNQQYLKTLKDWYVSKSRLELMQKEEAEAAMRLVEDPSMSREEKRRLKRLSEDETALQETQGVLEDANRRARNSRSAGIPHLPAAPELLEVPVDDELIIEEIAVEAEAIEEDISSDVGSGRQRARSNPKIKLLAWQPEAPYLDSLKNAKTNDVMPLYHRLKETYEATPSFFIEVADFFIKKNEVKQGVTILSNILEMDLENPELLKVVARRLLDENQVELAISVYSELVELRPEEPQSYRDLALAYIQHKEYQKALDLFHKILHTRWQRFESIKEIVLNEMNALISKHKSSLDMSKMNKDLIYEMPIDVRIVIDWSSNDNDIDLWVTDPQGEKCSYQNKRTQIGGKISADIRNGYGPEEFTLKKAVRGFYTVYVNYYSDSRQKIVGPVTVYATMYTNYGRQNERVETIAFQLEEGKKTLQIGQLEF